MFKAKNKNLIFLISTILILAFVGITSVSIMLRIANQNLEAANTTKKIIDKAEVFTSTILGYETNLRGFLLSRDSISYKIAENFKINSLNELSSLKALAVSNPESIKMIDSLVILTKVKIEHNQVLLNAIPGKVDIKPGRKVMYAILLKKDLIKKTEEAVFKKIENKNNTIIFSLQILATILVIIISIFIWLLFIYIKNQIDADKEYTKQLLQKSLLIKNSNDAIITTDENFYIQSWNLGAESMIGYSEKEVIGKKLSSIVHIAFNSDVEKDTFKKQIATKGFWKGEVEQVSKNGERKNVLLSYSASYNEQQKITGYSTIRTDITPLKKLEKELREINASLEKEVDKKTKEIKDVFDRIKKSFISFNIRKEITYVNKHFANVLNKKQEDLIGKHYSTVFPIKKDSPIHADAFNAFLNRNIITNEVFVEEFNVWVEYSIYPDAEGVSVYFSNTTKKKKSEQELQEKTTQIINNFERIKKGFISFNPQKRITYANKVLADFIQKNQSDLIGQHYTVLFPNIKDSFFHELGVESYNTQTIISKEEYLQMFNAWVSFTIYPDKDGISVYFSDISEKKKNEKELEEKNKQLQDLTKHIENLREEERKQIARDLHDDLGQLATILKIDITRLKNQLLKTNPEYESKIQDLLNICTEFVYKIKKISFSLRPDILDNLGLITTIDNQCKEFSKTTGIVTQFNHNIKGERLLPAIETAFFRIAQEALTNVIRHAKCSKVLVLLQEENNEYILSIEDNGVGFNTSTTSNSLGLLGIKERANSIQAICEINSSINKGTTIKIKVNK